MAIVVVDGQVGLTDGDMEVRNFIFDAVKKKVNLRVLLCVNKCESFQFGDVLAEVGSTALSRFQYVIQQFWRLGLGKPYPVSALHGTGIAELLNKFVA